jgi:hypothetical protein
MSDGGLPPTSHAPNRIATADLAAGTCFHDRTVGPGIVVSHHRAVDCTAEHHAEVFTVGKASGDAAFPGAEELDRQSGSHCAPQLDAFVLDYLSLSGDTQLIWHVPDEKEWSAGARYIVCLLAVGRPLTRSLRMDASTLDDDQERFLAAVQDYNALYEQISSTYPPPGLARPSHDSRADRRGAGCRDGRTDGRSLATRGAAGDRSTRRQDQAGHPGVAQGE